MKTNTLNDLPKSLNSGNTQTKPKQRYFGIDILRVFSCYMVMQIHSGECYFFDEHGVREGTAPFWIGIYNSMFYSCVPLFIMISGYLLLPVKTDIRTFLKTRFTRILFPFFFWSTIYSFYYLIIKRIDVKQCILNIPKILVNYGVEIGHLWYIYMLIGIYLFAPIISPWIKEATINQFFYFLSFWFLSLFLNYIHLVFPKIWGECSWNNTPMLQSFTGHFGYAVLGSFIKIHLDSNEKYNFYWLGFLLLAFGYAITAIIFEYEYCFIKINGPDHIELSTNYSTFNIAMMTCGFFLILRRIQCNNKIVVNVVKDIALKSYGMYLAHMIFLEQFQQLIDPECKKPYFFIPIIAICTYIVTYIVIKMISYVPYSKYLIG